MRGFHAIVLVWHRRVLLLWLWDSERLCVLMDAKVRRFAGSLFFLR